MAAKKPVTLTSPSATIRTVAAKRSVRLHKHFVHTRYVHFSKNPRRH